MQKLRSLTTKFVWLYFAFVITIIVTFSVTFFLRFNSQILTDARIHARETATAISHTVDFTDHGTLQTLNQMESETYKRIFDDLYFASQVSPDIEYVYTMRPKENQEWEFVIDASPEIDVNKNKIIDDDEASADIGETYDISCCPEIPKALHSPSADQSITSDVWGNWLSGYAPIEENGEVVGIIGVDINADELIQRRKYLISTTAITILITISLGSWMLYLSFYLTKKQFKNTANN